ncbi:battenin [Rhopalosiphum padi]|uniref:battenin n=1 Tax=Rhopalosiphum padi TaxID=40932 RepID=UPI00298E4396|nr:battenin [Rhopalosiphum padi]XP_060846819.1 battenin [Rhopalosiphum padi]XP_060846820.1 battenin [Rhopalosiphum padi]
MENVEVKASILTLASFWILGLCNNFGYVVMLSSAHDILNSNSATSGGNKTVSLNSTQEEYKRECNHLSTGVILLADIIPGLLIKTFSPFFALYINRRLSLCISLTIASFITVAKANTELVAAVGVALTSMASGLGESTLLSYMINYERNVITSWSSGTGAAGILGALTYAGLTGVFHLSPSTTMYLMLSVPFLMAVSFWVLLEHPKKDQISTMPNDCPDLSTNSQSLSNKLSYVPSLLKFMIPLGLVYFFEYLINQGLFELVYFEKIWLTHAEQYRWYQVLYQLGVFVSRTSVNLFPIEKIWILTILQGFNVVFFLIETLYSFTPNIYIIFAMIGFEGLLGGGAYANSYHNIMKKVPKERQEFSMAMTSLSDSIGVTLAGLLAIPLHNRICYIPK